MVERIRTHKSNLEEIRKKLKPGKLRNVLNTTVEVWINDISKIFDYFEEIEETEEEAMDYISSIPILNPILSKITRELETALFVWDLRNDTDRAISQRSDAMSEYMERLNNCYGLLKEALNCFKSVEQTKEVIITEENEESARKTS